MVSVNRKAKTRRLRAVNQRPHTGTLSADVSQGYRGSVPWAKVEMANFPGCKATREKSEYHREQLKE